MQGRRWIKAWLGGLAAVVVGLAGCGGGSDTPSATSASGTVGADGGRVTAEAVTVIVPPGAMTQDTTIRVAADSSGSPDLPAWTRVAGDMLQLTPHGSTFAEPVTVRLRAPTVTLAEDERLMIAKAQPGGSWEVLGDTEQVGDQLEVRVTSFSYFVPVIVKFDPAVVDALATPFTMSAPSFTCSGAACAAPVMLGTAVNVTSSGNGGALPAGCVNPRVQLRYRTDILRSWPATPNLVVGYDVTWSSVAQVYADGYLSLIVALSCVDATTNATSVLTLASGRINVDTFSLSPVTPLIRSFPTNVTAAPGDRPTMSGVLTRGASYRTGLSTFTAPTATDQATVYLEKLAVGDSVWRSAATGQQVNANPRPTGAVSWAYWGLDFTLPAVTDADNGALYRLRACYQAPTAATAACNIGPVATLTVVQQTVVPAFTQQPASVLVQPGQTASFTARASGTPTPALQWQTRAAGASAWAAVTAGVGATTGDFTTPIVTVADNGRQYRLVATNAAGETASDAVTLTVNADLVAPTIQAQPASLAVVAGSEAVFAVSAQGTAALSYQWLRNGVALPGANAPQLKLSAVSVGDAASYAVRVSNAAGQVQSDPAVLAVNATTGVTPTAPTIVTQPAAVAVHEGNVATFAVGVSGSGPFTYQWFRNGQVLTGATAAAYTLPAATLAQAGNYAVVVSNATGSVTSQAATLGVAPALATATAPTITTPPVSVAALPGATTTLAVAASGTGPLAYQWFQDGAPVSGANGPTLTFDSLDAISNGAYTVRVSNAVGSVTSAAAQLRVIGAPQITTAPVDAAVNEGVTASFGVQATGDGLRYQWLRNGVAIDGATSASYLTPTAALADSGAVYAVIVYNGAGLVTSGGAVLSVSADPGVLPPPPSLDGRLATGFNHTCVVTSDSRLACWGDNGNGQLGNGSTTASTKPVFWTLPEPVTRVAAGFTMSCAITRTTARVFCSGHVVNALVPTEVPNLSEVVDIAAGAQHACALKADGTVWCWGGNSQYELGNGNTVGNYTPVQVMADVGLPLTGVARIDATERHTCAVLDTGAGGVRCWGANNYHQLGYDPLAPGAGDPGYARLVPGLTNVAQAVAGSAHTCALLNDGTVSCWGLNNLGQLGLGTLNAVSQPVTTPTTVPSMASVVQMAAGTRKTCALTIGGTVSCWGSAWLGNGIVSEAQPNPVAVTGLTEVQSLDAGNDHVCVMRQGGGLMCWGSNSLGQFGNGNTSTSGVPIAAAGGLLGWQP